MTATKIPAILSVLLALGGGDASFGQVQRSGGGASAALVQQYQQAVAEKTQLEADNTKLKTELDDAKKQLEATKKQLAASKSGASASAASALAAAQAARDSSAQALEQSKARMQELVGRFRDTAVTLRSVESERSQLQQQLAQSKADFDRCAERNYDLYQVDREVLDRYEHEGAFSHLARAEPFTRIKRARVENLVEEYKQRAEELRVQKAAATAGASAKSPAPVPFAAPTAPTGVPATVQPAAAGPAPPN
jgi:chromosome segregation ATPase